MIVFFLDSRIRVTGGSYYPPPYPQPQPHGYPPPASHVGGYGQPQPPIVQQPLPGAKGSYAPTAAGKLFE